MTNNERLFKAANESRFVKDAFHRYVVHGETAAVNPQNVGTKAAARYCAGDPGRRRGHACDCGCMPRTRPRREVFGDAFSQVFAARRAEADEFYAALLPNLDGDDRRIARSAYAGLLWSKQFYDYVVDDWLEGDPETPPPPDERKSGRNSDWRHLFSRDVLSMPDKWEYPWFAAWDLAFHMIPFARLDPVFARDQLSLFLREWYMHPNGQLPAYEFDLGDVQSAGARLGLLGGLPAHDFGRERSAVAFPLGDLPEAADEFHLVGQSQGLAGQAPLCRRIPGAGQHRRLRPLAAAAQRRPVGAGRRHGLDGLLLRHDAFHGPGTGRLRSGHGGHRLEVLRALRPHRRRHQHPRRHAACGTRKTGSTTTRCTSTAGTCRLRLRSIVGLVPLLAVEVLPDAMINDLPGFHKRLVWFLRYRRDLSRHISYMETRENGGNGGSHLLAIPSRERLVRVLRYMLDEDEFLSPFGIRSLSKCYGAKPYVFHCGNQEFRVQYLPGESDSGLFGGNSNWRGPIWFPLNYLLIEALGRYHRFYGDSLKVECPTGSGRWMTLDEVARELATRLVRLFRPDGNGRRPYQGNAARIGHGRTALFYEYFDAETGRGLGASHQTGWTALVASCLEKLAEIITARSRTPSKALSSWPRSIRAS